MSWGAPKGIKIWSKGWGVRPVRRQNYSTKVGNTWVESWWALVAKVRKRSGGQCEATGCRNAALEVHHIIPLSRGGTNAMTNLIHLCKDCHDRRHQHLFRARSKG